MAFDAAFLRGVVAELQEALVGLKVDKVAQPESDCIIITFRGPGGGRRLLLSANASGSRLHLTCDRRENPKTAPMFCMLLRKHLSGGRLLSITQPDFERVADLSFEVYNELGELVVKHLAVEIMGRHSNIILYEDGGRIIDSIRRVDFTVSRQRQILPALIYEAPPQQGKINPLEISRHELFALLSAKGEKKADKFLLETFCGLSPLICREIVFRAVGGCDLLMSDLSDDGREKLAFHFLRMMETIKEYDFTPVILHRPQDNKPAEFTFTPIRQYGLGMSESRRDTFSELLDAFYESRDKIERIRRRSHDILKVVTASIERNGRKLALQHAELEGVRDRDRLKLFGDLIMSNLYRIEGGATELLAENYFEEGAPTVKIELDGQKSAAANAQHYYGLYAKAKVKESWLTRQIKSAEQELIYLESVFDNLSKAENEAELLELRQELAEGGYIKGRAGNGKKSKSPPPSSPMTFLSDDGFTIMVGKNNLQNDRLTLKTARRGDIWLHTKNIPGSHTVIFTQGKEPPPLTVTQAAVLAATFSKARDSKNVPVDYTDVKNVKKPQGSPPGMVIYEKNRTAFVDPHEGLAERLRRK